MCTITQISLSLQTKQQCPLKMKPAQPNFINRKIESAFENISKFTEDDRQHYIKYIVREDEQTNWTTQPPYDALLIRYLTELLRKDEAEPEQTEPLPLLTSSITELDQLSRKIASESLDVLAKLDGKFMMQELASISRARDYIIHLEAKVNRESGFVEHMLLKENLKKFYEIEANIQR